MNGPSYCESVSKIARQLRANRREFHKSAVTTSVAAAGISIERSIMNHRKNELDIQWNVYCVRKK